MFGSIKQPFANTTPQGLSSVMPGRRQAPHCSRQLAGWLDKLPQVPSSNHDKPGRCCSLFLCLILFSSSMKNICKYLFCHAGSGQMAGNICATSSLVPNTQPWTPTDPLVMRPPAAVEQNKLQTHLHERPTSTNILLPQEINKA